MTSTGVAVGAGWQSTVAYVNIGCYYLIGIPVGIVLGNIIHLQVKVGYYVILSSFEIVPYSYLFSFIGQTFFLCRVFGLECCLGH